MVILPKNFSLSFQKYVFGIRDPKKPSPDPLSRGQKGTVSRTDTLLCAQLTCCRKHKKKLF
jgi:hypothetical protein